MRGTTRSSGSVLCGMVMSSDKASLVVSIFVSWFINILPWHKRFHVGVTKTWTGMG